MKKVHSRWRRMFYAPVCALVFGVLLTSCAGEASPRLKLPAKNVDQWTMPLNQYRQSLYEDFAEGYADKLAAKACVEEHGIAWPVPYDDLSLRSPTLNAVGQRIFNREIASTWGYQVAPIMRPNRGEWRAFDDAVAAIDDAQFEAVVRPCQRKVEEEQLPLSQDDTNYVNALAMDADIRSRESGDVKKADRRWRECMAPLGVSDLADTPERMPTESQQRAWGTFREKDGGAVMDKPSDAQLKAAVFDYDCQVTSGWLKARYDTTWDAEVEILAKNSDEIIRRKAKADAIAKKVAKIIAENAPSAP
ncbi:hypothetical protein ACFOYW_10045 [Gryllotalpicola reticulitermitis]|uniref:Lipoprotein n=1 Tax=Gryllotalpicola reticulitermitis TaxID=1184153 RepID=A0ABV8Q5W0_9MICO